MKKILPLLLMMIISSCSCQEKIVNESRVSAFYQGWTAGVRGGGSGINFNLELKKELPSNVQLKKLVFKGYEVPFDKQDDLHFMAMIKTEANQQKFEGDNSQSYSSPKSSIKTKDNEAILIFTKDGKEYQQKITNVVEKPALEYPSAKPKF
ncbi:hypothetical protein [Flavobacterium channae]|uniref:hypothetical protein n=1 Tax=Flavobacterium channae TaxID=2897181 RepID=UPI001E4BE9CD|nr:hypothetical protein [Flavobacterium channae]UGS23535.1 hypothetical protein LOS89_12365 [Flavobacterium channae]